MAWGKLARWNADKKFGFVKSDYPLGDDIFLFGAVLRRAGIEPVVGTCLEFDTEVHNGRPRVKSVKRLKTYRDAATDEGADD